MKYEDILYEVENRIATLTFNLPESRNPISGERIIAEIEDVCREVRFSDDVSVLSSPARARHFPPGAT